jgi:prephenate dehydrogenase
VAVLGLGLLGGSVAWAARRRGLARRVVGATRRSDVLEAALRRGAVDEVGDPEQAVRGADLVVLATPLFAMGDLVRRIAPALAPGVLLTDVGSVKGPLVETLPGLLPRGARFVGAHPMAGSHHSGFGHADPDLFEGAACVVTGSPDDPDVARVSAFWSALGARVRIRQAAEHDAQVAWVSHLPHLLAFAFSRALADAPPGAAELAGPGFHDFTRIARADPELWADILTANRKALGAPLQAVAASLSELGRAVEAGDSETVERCLSAARAELARISAALPARDPRAPDSQPQPPSGSPGRGQEPNES